MAGDGRKWRQLTAMQLRAPDDPSAGQAAPRFDDVSRFETLTGESGDVPGLGAPTPLDTAIGGGERKRGLAAGVASVMLHVALIAWLVWSPPQDAVGGGGVELDAVSVDLVTAAALESLAARASAAGAAGPVADAPGVDAPEQPELAAAAATPKPAESAEPDRAPPPPPDIVAKPDPVLEADAPLTIAETPLPPPETPPVPTPEERPVEPEPEAPVERVEPEPEAKPTPAETAPAEAQAAVVTGGAVTRGTEGTIAAEGAAGASAGALAKYALEVRLALGRARPRHDGAKGRVLISFSLAASGSIVSAAVARSSGTASADAAALAAVMRAAFPLPPEGSTDAQRTYTVPFDFK